MFNLFNTIYALFIIVVICLAILGLYFQYNPNAQKRFIIFFQNIIIKFIVPPVLISIMMIITYNTFINCNNNMARYKNLDIIKLKKVSGTISKQYFDHVPNAISIRCGKYSCDRGYSEYTSIYLISDDKEYILNTYVNENLVGKNVVFYYDPNNIVFKFGVNSFYLFSDGKQITELIRLEDRKFYDSQIKEIIYITIFSLLLIIYFGIYFIIDIKKQINEHKKRLEE